MHWVLIIISLGAVNHIKTVPFATQSLCETARKDIAAARDSWSSLVATSCSRTSPDVVEDSHVQAR